MNWNATRFLKSALLWVVWMLGFAVATLPGLAKPSPHIVIFLADDLGWGDVGFHGGSIPTPNIDALAHRGLRLEQFYAQPLCSPTRAALMTGRYPMRLGLQTGVIRPWASHGLPLDERTLPQALREAGYTTAICGKWHLGHFAPEYLPTRRGFDRQYGHYNGAIDYFTHIRDGGHDWHKNDAANHDKGYATDLIAAGASDFISGQEPGKPLFLYVPFNAPHSPLQAPEEWMIKFTHIENKKHRTYAAMVACMDAAIGRILATLENRGFKREDTLVLFSSDNGGIASIGSNGPYRGQKDLLYEGGIRVPTVVSWPGSLPTGKLVNEPLHIVDVYPTLLRLARANLDQEKPIDGHDMWPVLSGGETGAREFILHNVNAWSGALRAGKWKLIHNGTTPTNTTVGPARETWELFDIEADPYEKTELSARHPEVVAKLKDRLESLRASAVPAKIAPKAPPRGFKTPAVWGQP